MEYVSAFIGFDFDQHRSVSLNSGAAMLTAASRQTGQVVTGRLENLASKCLFQCFETLMNGIEKNLHSKNRDRFTHGLSIFRREVNDVLKV